MAAKSTVLDTLGEECQSKYQIDQKTINSIKLNQTITISKGEIIEPFQIETELRHGDGLSLILFFNLVLDKIMKTLWGKKKTGIKLGTKSQNVKIKCLAFVFFEKEIYIIKRTSL